MLRLLLFRFWPVLIPLLVYWLWRKAVVRKATKAGVAVPPFHDAHWYWLVLSSLAIGVLCFVFWGATTESVKGTYIPPHMENGAMVSGHVEPKP